MGIAITPRHVKERPDPDGWSEDGAFHACPRSRRRREDDPWEERAAGPGRPGQSSWSSRRRRAAGLACLRLADEAEGCPPPPRRLAPAPQARSRCRLGGRTVLRSQAFFARQPGDAGAGPVEFIVGVARALDTSDPPSSSLLLGSGRRGGRTVLTRPTSWLARRGWLTPRPYWPGELRRRRWSSGNSRRRRPLDVVPWREARAAAATSKTSRFSAELLTGTAGRRWLKRLLAGWAEGEARAECGRGPSLWCGVPGSPTGLSGVGSDAGGSTARGAAVARGYMGMTTSSTKMILAAPRGGWWRGGLGGVHGRCPGAAGTRPPV